MQAPTIELSDEAEEVLEKLWLAERDGKDARVAELPAAHRPGVVEELRSAGLLEDRSGELVFTLAGRERGRDVVRRHYLAERLLADVLDVGAGDVESAACRLEHVLLQAGIPDRICTMLGHPRVCPHGEPIPEGPCCRERPEAPARVVSALADLEGGASGRIAYLCAQERQKLQKLMAMGALPGLPITLLQRAPSFVFQLGQTQVAVDREIAECIYVRLDAAPILPRQRRWRWGAEKR